MPLRLPPDQARVVPRLTGRVGGACPPPPTHTHAHAQGRADYAAGSETAEGNTAACAKALGFWRELQRSAAASLEPGPRAVFLVRVRALASCLVSHSLGSSFPPRARGFALRTWHSSFFRGGLSGWRPPRMLTATALRREQRRGQMCRLQQHCVGSTAAPMRQHCVGSTLAAALRHIYDGNVTAL